jgi:hypothetical protein
LKGVTRRFAEDAQSFAEKSRESTIIGVEPKPCYLLAVGFQSSKGGNYFVAEVSILTSPLGNAVRNRGYSDFSDPQIFGYMIRMYYNFS